MATSPSSSSSSPHQPIMNATAKILSCLQAATLDEPSLASVVLQAILLLALIGLSIIVNCLVFIVFYQRPALRTLSNRFVLSLVTSNFLTTLLLMPVALISLLMQQWVFSMWYCKLSKVLATMLSETCTLSLVLIACDRYFAVMSPLHYGMTMTRGRSSVLIGTIWTIATLMAAYPVFGLPSIDLDATDDLSVPCSKQDIQGPLPLHLCCNLSVTLVALICPRHRWWVALTLLFSGFVMPLLLIIWIYTCMYRAAHQTSARARQHSVTYNQSVFCPEESVDSPTVQNGDAVEAACQFQQQVENVQQQRKHLFRRRSSNTSLSFVLFREEGKAARTGIMVVSSFLCCWMPFFISLLFDAFADSCPRLSSFRQAVQLLMFFGCLINPFIYVYRNDIARHEACRLVCCNQYTVEAISEKPQPIRLERHASPMDDDPLGDCGSYPNSFLECGGSFYHSEGLVRKLSYKVYKSVSLAEEIVKGHRHGLGRSRENVEDQIKMVENGQHDDWIHYDDKNDEHNENDETDADNAKSKKRSSFSDNRNIERKLARYRSLRIPIRVVRSNRTSPQDEVVDHRTDFEDKQNNVPDGANNNKNLDLLSLHAISPASISHQDIISPMSHPGSNTSEQNLDLLTINRNTRNASIPFLTNSASGDFCCRSSHFLTPNFKEYLVTSSPSLCSTSSVKLQRVTSAEAYDVARSNSTTKLKGVIDIV